jgi:GxGYxY sequence motif in domain of unknown function N-terminal/GxGYxYP putative glycoside hydrolase C-terminal domain
MTVGLGTPAASAATAASTAKPASSTPDLWPTLSPFRHLVTADMQGATADQTLAATTLEGAYNAQQRPDRLYIEQRPADSTWLATGALGSRSGQTPLATSGSGPAAVLDALLADYGPLIKGAVVTNANDPDTINLATTMAGIDDAMVATPAQVPMLQAHGIPVLYTFARQSFSSPTAAYQWEVDNLLPLTNDKDLVLLNPTVAGGIRDEAVATGSFVFFLTSTDSSEAALMQQIITSRASNTPILGYIADEGPDVAYLSSLGHFLNASDFFDNGSDWAAVSSPPGLSQPSPGAVAAQPRTAYVSFVESEGDNAQYVQERMFDLWHEADFGTVPEGWTLPPGMIDYAPSMMQWFYGNRPRSSELMAGPSGVGYATAETGGNLTQFAQLSGAFMRRDGMSTVDYWGSPSALSTYASAAGIPSMSYAGPLAFTQDRTTAAVGQTSGYTDPANSLLDTIEQDTVNEMAASPGAPVYLEPLVDSWNLSTQDVLAVAQSYTRWAQAQGEQVVFLTPGELAATEQDAANGTQKSLPATNAEAVTGDSLLALPSAGQLTGYVNPTPAGPNLVSNPSGQNGTSGWSSSAGILSAGTQGGGPALNWVFGQTQDSQQWASTYPAVQGGLRYTFSVQVSGSGQVFLDVWNGSSDVQSPAIQLGSGWQTLTWTTTLPTGISTTQNGSAPQLQVREDGVGPVNVWIRNATVQQSST